MCEDLARTVAGLLPAGLGQVRVRYDRERGAWVVRVTWSRRWRRAGRYELVVLAPGTVLSVFSGRRWVGVLGPAYRAGVVLPVEAARAFEEVLVAARQAGAKQRPP